MERVRLYQPDDAEAVKGLLVRAFHDDPGYVHTFPEGRTRALQTILPPLLELRRASGSVRVFEREGEVVGCLVSGPSTVRFGLADYLRHGLATMPFTLGFRPVQRMLSVDAEIGQLRNRVVPPVAHRYLATLACDPDHQGTGVGGRLMRAFLDEDVDPTRQYAALMTTKSDNVRWYRTHGFRVAGQCGIHQAFTAFCMVRPARTG
jgi:predicted N-acetyltransferase YhbS